MVLDVIHLQPRILHVLDFCDFVLFFGFPDGPIAETAPASASGDDEGG